jgi:hypothetical protein
MVTDLHPLLPSCQKQVHLLSTLSSNLGSSRSSIGSALGCRPPGRVIDPVSGVCFIHKFASLTQVAPRSKYSFISAKPGLKQLSSSGPITCDAPCTSNSTINLDKFHTLVYLLTIHDSRYIVAKVTTSPEKENRTSYCYGTKYFGGNYRGTLDRLFSSVNF